MKKMSIKKNGGWDNTHPLPFNDVLRYLSLKQWNLVSDFKEKIEQVTSKSLTKDEQQQITNYAKYFKEPLRFEHNLTTYKTGRIFAQYVLFPNKEISGLNLKELIIPNKGYVFVSFDYTASQIRHLASYKNIKWLIDFFNKDEEDIYEKFAKETQLTRKEAKLLLILLLYGGDEKTIINNFPNMKEEQAKEIIKTHERWFEIEGYDYEAKSRLARTIQQIEADFIKEKMAYIYRKQDLTHNLHAVLHDEIVLEIHKDHLDLKDKLKRFLEKHPKVKMKVKVKESNTFKFK